VSEFGLTFGCLQTIARNTPLLLGAPSPANLYLDLLIGSHDGLVWDSDWIAATGDGRLTFDADVIYTQTRFSSWENVYFGSTRTDGRRTAFDLVALQKGTIQSSNVSATLLFDRLTLENTAITIVDAQSADGRQTGQIDSLFLGFGASGRGGGLTMRNASLVFEDGTRFGMNGPANTVPFIRAESGENHLQIGIQNNFSSRALLEVGSGATLTVAGTALNPSVEGSLRVDAGGTLNVQADSVLQFASNDGTTLPRTTINAGTVNVSGQNSQLRLTDPIFTDSTVRISDGATLQIQERNNGESALSFSGDSVLAFDGAQSSVVGPNIGRELLTFNVGNGTTRVVGSNQQAAGAGLRVSSINIDGGTLDTTQRNATQDQVEVLGQLSIENGGVFRDDRHNYNALDQLNVQGGTLRSTSNFGSFASASGMSSAIISDAELNLFQGQGTVLTPGLTSIGLSANTLEFTGNNIFRFGVSPTGECIRLGGACLPNSTSYAGSLAMNVGGVSGASLTGFDTVQFVPMAVDPSASVADYVNGGENGIYTVATVNQSDAPNSNLQGFDAAPTALSVAQLTAAGSDLPANLTYAIVNDPVADGRVDIAFLDTTLQNHPSVTTGYTPQFTQRTVVEPVTQNTHDITVSILPDPDQVVPTTWQVVEPQTGNITTLTQTVMIDPGNGHTTQEITTIVTEPNGAVVSTDSVTVPLDGNGATQAITSTITEPSGTHVTTITDIVTLDPARGTGVPPLKWSTFWDRNIPFSGGGRDGRQTREARGHRAEAATG